MMKKTNIDFTSKGCRTYRTYVGFIFRILLPPKVATYKFPCSSIVMPSGTNGGGRSPLSKLITLRSLAIFN